MRLLTAVTGRGLLREALPRSGSSGTRGRTAREGWPKLGQNLLLVLMKGNIENAEADLGKDPFGIAFVP